MELHPEYIRDMHNHYMILKGNIEDKYNYTAKMLMNNTVPGIIQTEFRYLDSMDLYYYDITSKKTIKSVYEGKVIDYETTKKLIEDMLQIIENSQEYLLIEHDFIITPEFVFLNNSNQTELCYMPGYSANILKQLSSFFEYIMNQIDYKDESAVRLIYALYKESKDVECTFYKLYEVINHPYLFMPEGKKEANQVDALQSVSPTYHLAKEKLQSGSNNNENQKRDKFQVKEINKGYNNKEKINYKNNNHKSGYRKEIIPNKKKLYETFINKKRESDKTTSNKIESSKTAGSKILSNKTSSKISTSESPLIDKSLFKVKIPTISPKTNKAPENYYIKGDIDKGEVVNDREIFYYGQLSYLLAGASILTGIIILLAIYFSGIVSNTLDSGVDSVKMVACILMVVCIEIYIMTKIFDSNKKLTKMESVVEYIKEIETDNYYIDSTVEESFINIAHLEEDKALFKEDKTHSLWSEYSNDGEDKTQLLTSMDKSKYYCLTPIRSKASLNEKLINMKVIDFPFYIGKNSNLSNMVIEDKSISRRHGVITCMEDKIFYTDLDSTNGTFINGNKLEGNKVYKLCPFDEISFANIKYLWEEFEGE